MAKRKQIRRRLTAPVVFRDKSRGGWRGYVVQGGKRSYARGKSRQDVLEKLTDVRAVSAETAAAGRMTFRGLRLRWIDSLKTERAPNTLAYYEAALSLCDRLDPWILEDISTAAILDVLSPLESSARREDVFVTLSALFKAGKRWGLTTRNPMDRVDRPKHNPKKPRPFQADEVARILTASESNRYRGAVLIGLTLGLRPGELFGLQWGDADFDSGTIHVQRQAAELSGRVTVKSPKTQAGIRSILLPVRVVDVLKERQAAAMKEGNAGSPWIFPNRSGAVTRRSNFTHRHWNKILEAAAVDQRGPHQMRHTAASAMLNNGVPITLVSRILGHEKPSTTLDIYGHLMIADQLRAVEFWDRQIS